MKLGHFLGIVTLKTPKCPQNFCNIWQVLNFIMTFYFIINCHQLPHREIYASFVRVFLNFLSRNQQKRALKISSQLGQAQLGAAENKLKYQLKVQTYYLQQN